VRERAANNSGLLYLASGLETPVSPFWRAKSPKVSGRFRKYSRFQETTARDLVRTPLPGEGGSSALTRITAAWPGGVSPGIAAHQLIFRESYEMQPIR